MEVLIGWEKKKTASERHGLHCIGRRAKLDQRKERQEEVKERLIRADSRHRGRPRRGFSYKKDSAFRFSINSVIGFFRDRQSSDHHQTMPQHGDSNGEALRYGSKGEHSR